MEEIKSSFQPIDKLIESFNEPIYVITYFKKNFVGKYGNREFEVYLCSNTKSLRNKLYEVVNDKMKKDSRCINWRYKNHITYCGKQNICHEKHKLFEYIDFVMEGTEMGDSEYVFSEIKKGCPQDILLQIAEEFIVWHEIKINKEELLVE